MARPPAAVPVARSLEDIYPADVLPTQLPRWRALGARFRSLHDGGAPAFVARSPGRVNIIGEHIDYSLYPVLPMAVVADVLIATGWSLPARETGFEIRIDNMDPARFKSRTFTIANVPEGDEGDEVDVGIDATTHEWTNYFKAGLAGALRLLRRRGRDQGMRPMDLRVLVDGTVPPGGGLSSSAALVSASALAVLVANEQGADHNLDEVAIDRRELTELAIVSERAIGVNSGGMDQAASVLSERDAALLVSFYPSLDATPLRLPVTDPPLSFLIAQSFVRSDKYVTGPVNYNLRVVECTLAASCLNAILNPAGTRLPGDASPLGVSLRGFHETYFSAQESGGGGGGGGDAARRGKLGDELEVLIGLVEDTLTSKDGYTRDEIAQILGIKVADLEARFMARFPIRAVRFKLRQRALHVFAEALRVQVFVDSLEHPGADLPVKLGQLLIASQESCRELYECSCAEIDTLCEIGLEAGALGSRVTGAGWGGCSVHLVPAHRVKEVRQGWEDKYYRPRLGGLSEAEAAGAVVETRPGSGSAIFVGEI